jgi:hypothetical protein
MRTKCEHAGQRVNSLTGGWTVPGLADLVPDADTLLALAPEDLGMILLKLVQAERTENVAPSNFETPLWNVTRPGYPYSKNKLVGLAFAEAW